MKKTLSTIYDSLILKRPVTTLVITMAMVGIFAWHIPDFRLDASGDSLVLENDADLYYHRQTAERYGSGDALVVTYTSGKDLFSDRSISDLKELRDELQEIKGVDSVTSLLDVPLIFTTGISLSDVADKDKLMTLEKSGVERNTVIKELHENPLYKGRLLSEDSKTTALLINLTIDQDYRSLLARRYKLREKKSLGTLTGEETIELRKVTEAYRLKLTSLQHNESRLVEAIRQVIYGHQGKADIYLAVSR